MQKNLNLNLRQRQLGQFSWLDQERILKKRLYYDNLQLVAVLKGHYGCVNAINWSEDEELLISGSDDVHANIYSYDTKNLVHSVATGHTGNIFCAKFVPGSNSRQVVTCAADGEIRFRDLHADSPLLLYSTHQMVVKLEFHPDNPSVFLATSGEKSIRLVDIRDRKTMIVGELKKGSTSVSFDPFRSNCFSISGDDSWIRIFDLRKRPASNDWSCSNIGSVGLPHMLLRTYMSGGVSGIDYCHFKPGYLAANYRDADVYLFDTHRHIAEKPTGKYIQSYSGRVNRQTFAKEIAFVNGGSCLATGGDDGYLYLWKTETGKLVDRLKGDSCIVNCVIAKRYDPTVVTSGIDSTIKIWEHLEGKKKFDSEKFRPDSESEWYTEEEEEAEEEDDDEDDDHSQHLDSSDSESDDEIPLDQRMRSSLEVVSINEAKTRIKEAEALRTEGNVLFKAKSYTEAVAVYKQCLLRLAFFLPSPELHGDFTQQVILTSLNLAATYMALKDYNSALCECGGVLALDPVNVKALFRKASSLIELQRYQEAIDTLQEAKKIAPNEPEFDRLANLVAQRKQAALDQEKELIRRMFRS